MMFRLRCEACDTRVRKSDLKKVPSRFHVRDIQVCTACIRGARVCPCCNQTHTSPAFTSDYCTLCLTVCPKVATAHSPMAPGKPCVKSGVSDEEFEQYRQRLLKEVTGAVRESVAEA